MSVVACTLEAANTPYAIYADDIVIFYTHKAINHSCNLLNHSLGNLDAEFESCYIFY